MEARSLKEYGEKTADRFSNRCSPQDKAGRRTETQQKDRGKKSQ